MEKKYLFAALVALIAMPSFAQSEKHYEYDEYGKVGRSEGWARRFAHNFYDGLIGAEYYEIVEDNGSKSKVKTEKNDFEININSGKSYRYYGPGHTPHFYIGLNSLCTDQPPTLSPELPQKYGKGFELGFSLGQWGYHMTRNVGLNTAVYLTRSRYWFEDGKYLAYSRITGKRTISLYDGEYDGDDVRRGYLRYWSLRVPLCLEISSTSRRGPFLAFGPEIEYRFADVSKIEFEGNRDKEKIKDMNVNPLGFNAVVRVGIDHVGIIARYSFTSLFSNDIPAQTYPFMIGFSSSF